MTTGAASTRSRCRRGAGARGETLIELLATVTVMGIAVVAVVFGMAVAVKASGADRKHGRIEAVLRNGAEAISAAAYDPGGAYSGALAPVPALDADTATYSIGSVLRGCLDVNGSAAACDTGVQELTLTARSADGRISKTLVIVKRNAGVGSP
ncbi:MAG: hypothetical protein ACKOA9_10130 [Actinomycetota bacterium]